MNRRLAWTTTTLALTSSASLIHYSCTRNQALESENADLRCQVECWRDYTAELERELAQATAQAWDTVAEVPVRGVWESIVDARLAGEPERTWVVWADLDRFKEVNDRYGHLAGDAALRAVARRLEEAFAERSPVVTRLGGDEFGVLARDVEVETDLARFAALLAKPIYLPNGRLVRIRASLGVASAANLAPGAGREELLRVADADAYAQKPSWDKETRGASDPRARDRAPVVSMAMGAAR